MREVSIRKGGKGKSESEKGEIASRGGAKIRRRVEKQTPSILRIRIHGWPVFSEVYVDF